MAAVNQLPYTGGEGLHLRREGGAGSADAGGGQGNLLHYPQLLAHDLPYAILCTSCRQILCLVGPTTVMPHSNYHHPARWGATVPTSAAATGAAAGTAPGAGAAAGTFAAAAAGAGTAASAADVSGVFPHGIVPAVPSTYATVSSPAALSAPIARTSVGSDEGVPHPVRLLLLSRYIHIPTNAEHHMVKSSVRQRLVGEKTAPLDSKSRGNVARNTLVSVDIREDQYMATKPCPEHTTYRTTLVGAFHVHIPEAVPRLSGSGIFFCFLRLRTISNNQTTSHLMYMLLLSNPQVLCVRCSSPVFYTPWTPDPPFPYNTVPSTPCGSTP